MKKSILLSGLFLFSSLFCGVFAQGEMREDILNAKEKALDGLVSYHKEKYKNGLATYDGVIEAQIKLAEFKRDRAMTPADKVKYQKDLIVILTGKKKMAEEKLQGAAEGEEGVIKAEIALLDAKLLLLELENAAAQK